MSSARIWPPARLEVSQESLREKRSSESLGIPTAGFAAAIRRRSESAHVDEIGLPAVLKTRDDRDTTARANGSLHTQPTSRAHGRRSARRRSCSRPSCRSSARCRSSPCATRLAGGVSGRSSRTSTATESCASRGRRCTHVSLQIRAAAEDYARRVHDSRSSIRRSSRHRAVPAVKRSAGERDGAAGSQLGALDHRGRRDEPVREPLARDPLAPAREKADAIGEIAMFNLIGELPALGELLSIPGARVHLTESSGEGAKVGT